MMRHASNSIQPGNLIDKYIISSNANNGDDELFAQPIEDEDLFGIFPDDNLDKNKDPCLSDLIDSDQENTNNHLEPGVVDQINDEQAQDDLFNDNFEDEIVGISGLSPMRTNDKIDVDKIFPDDYSLSSDTQKFKAGANNYENGGYIENNLEQQVTEAPSLVPQPSPAQLKNRRMKELILQQTQAKGLVPKRLADIDEDEMIEVMGEHSQPVSDTNTKLIFSRLFSRSKKAPESFDDRNKVSRETYKRNLRKKICAQKRKIWDSFQTEADGFDDEEELIGEGGEDVNEDEVEVDEDNNGDENDNNEDGDDEEMNFSEHDQNSDEEDAAEEDEDENDQVEGDGDEDEDDQVEGHEEQFEDDEQMSEDDEAVPKRYRISEDDDDDEDEDEDDACNEDLETVQKEERMILSEAEESSSDIEDDEEEEDEAPPKVSRKVIFESDSDE